MNCPNCGASTSQQGGQWVCMNCYWSSGYVPFCRAMLAVLSRYVLAS